MFGRRRCSPVIIVADRRGVEAISFLCRLVGDDADDERGQRQFDFVSRPSTRSPRTSLLPRQHVLDSGWRFIKAPLPRRRRLILLAAAEPWSQFSRMHTFPAIFLKSCPYIKYCRLLLTDWYSRNGAFLSRYFAVSSQTACHWTPRRRRKYLQ